jgi:hypothetical protein
VVQHQVYKDATNPARALTLFSDATVHDKATNKIDRYIQAGMFYMSPFDSRPNDKIDFGVANIHVNNCFKDLEQLENTVSSADDYNAPPFIPPQNSETKVELYYGFLVSKWRLRGQTFNTWRVLAASTMSTMPGLPVRSLKPRCSARCARFGAGPSFFACVSYESPC